MKTVPWLVSVGVHSLLLFFGGLTLQEAVVGIAPGRNSIEVNLVAAPSDPTPPSTFKEPAPPAIEPPMPTVEMPHQPVSFTPESLPVALPAAAPQAQPAPPRKSAPVAKPNRDKGKDTLTAQSSAGAIVDEEPDYLSNPAPLYPDEARTAGQQGVVTLDVIVGLDGQAETIRVSSSSGYYLLDDSARNAVQRYRFRPATVNGIKFRTHVKVPICFRLDG